MYVGQEACEHIANVPPLDKLKYLWEFVDIDNDINMEIQFGERVSVSKFLIVSPFQDFFFTICIEIIFSL